MGKCKSESCDREAVSQGYCSKCYKREKRKGTIVNVEVENTGLCNKEGCSRPKHAKGFCETHYRQIQRPNNMVKCSVEGCGKPNVANGLCRKHYGRVYTGRGLQDPIKEEKLCSIEGCTRKCHAKGFCFKHYERFLNHGDPSILLIGKNIGNCTECGERKAVCKGMCNRCRNRWRSANDEGYRAKNSVRNVRRRATRINSPSEKYTREQALEKTDGKCGLCGKEIDLSLRYPNPLCFTYDHILPVSKGGNNLLENIQPAHFSCNCSKNNKVG